MVKSKFNSKKIVVLASGSRFLNRSVVFIRVKDFKIFGHCKLADEMTITNHCTTKLNFY